MTRILLITLLAMLCCGALIAEPFHWTTFTSTSNVVNMIADGSHLWMATNGGLADYDIATGIFTINNSDRGLAMNKCQAVGKDHRGFIWAGHTDSRISRLNPLTGVVRQNEDLRGGGVYEITAIVDNNADVFVSTNNGIYRFAYYATDDNYRVQEVIKFPGEIRVAALAVSNGYLYAGTLNGLWRARADNPNLSQISAWRNFTTFNSTLPENSVIALMGTDSLTWLSTGSWIVSLYDTIFANSANIGVQHFAKTTASGWYVAANGNRVFVKNGDVQPWQAFGSALPSINGLYALRENSQTRIFAGIGDTDAGAGGISSIVYSDTATWSAILRAPGIGGNYITALGVDPQNKLWVGGGENTAGVYAYDGDHWTNYSRSNGYHHSFFNFEPRRVAFDATGGAWVATQGGGTAWFHNNTYSVFNTTDTTGFSAAGPRVQGIPGGSSFVVTRVASDADGNIYMSNRLSETNLPLIRVPADWIAQGGPRNQLWNYYTPAPLGVSNPHREVEELLVDPLHRIWMGATSDGLDTYILNDNGTPQDTTDDDWFHYLPANRQDNTTCFEAINKQVLSWAVDQQDYLWVGTVNGAYYTQGGIPYDLSRLRLICVADLPVGHRVNAIHVDAQDNKWFGTDEGVAVLDRNFVWIHVFQDASSVDHPSGLISNAVTAISSNAQTGDVWIGTADGLSKYASPYVAKGSLDKLWPYPNPFRADGSQHMRIDPQRFGGRFDELRVFTVSGALVRKLTWSDMTNPRGGGWDGRNDKGDLVAGGIYLLLASTTDGQSLTGKVAVLGR